jgi:hypothetical protein
MTKNPKLSGARTVVHTTSSQEAAPPPAAPQPNAPLKLPLFWGSWREIDLLHVCQRLRDEVPGRLRHEEVAVEFQWACGDLGSDPCRGPGVRGQEELDQSDGKPPRFSKGGHVAPEENIGEAKNRENRR